MSQQVVINELRDTLTVMHEFFPALHFFIIYEEQMVQKRLR